MENLETVTEKAYVVFIGMKFVQYFASILQVLLSLYPLHVQVSVTYIKLLLLSIALAA